MTSDTTYTGYESEPGEGYMQPDRVKVQGKLVGLIRRY